MEHICSAELSKRVRTLLTNAEIMAETVISEAPAEQSGAEDNQVRGPLSVEDLAASFVEQVETDQEAQQADEAKDKPPESFEEAEASADQEDVLSQSVNESEEESEEDTEEGEEAQPEAPSKGMQKTLKQINRLTARAKSAEETVELLKNEVLSLKAQANQGKAQEPTQPELENIQTFDDLENLRKEATAAKKFALQHIGKDFVEVDGKEYSDDDIRNILSQADEYLTEKIPQRSQYLAQRAQWTNDTLNQFPWLNSQDESEYAVLSRQLFNSIKGQKQYADVLDNLPNGDFVAGVLVKGIQSMQAEKMAATKPKKSASKKPKAPPPTDGGDASPPIENSTTRKQKEKGKILDRKGPLSANDLAAFLAE